MKKSNTQRNNLVELMKAMNVGDNDLSTKTGLPPTTIYRMKIGSTDPRYSTMKQLADFFKVTLGQIIGDEPLGPDVANSSDLKSGPSFSKIMVLNWDQVVSWKEAVRRVFGEKKWTYTDLVKSDNAFALEILSDEYGDLFPKKAMIFVEDVVPEVYPYYAMVAKKNSSEPFIMKVTRTVSGNYLTHPKDPQICFLLDAKVYDVLGVISGIKHALV